MNIEKNTTIERNMLTIKRPGNGFNPVQWDSILGEVVTKKFNEDEII